MFRDIFECLRRVVVEYGAVSLTPQSVGILNRFAKNDLGGVGTPGGALGGGSFNIAPGSGVVTRTTLPSGFVTMNV